MLVKSFFGHIIDSRRNKQGVYMFDALQRRNFSTCNIQYLATTFWNILQRHAYNMVSVQNLNENLFDSNCYERTFIKLRKCILYYSRLIFVWGWIFFNIEKFCFVTVFKNCRKVWNNGIFTELTILPRALVCNW